MVKCFKLTLFIGLIFGLFLNLPPKASAQFNQQTIETAIGNVISGGSGYSEGDVKFYCQYGAVNSKGRLSSLCSWNDPSKTCFWTSDPSPTQCDIAGTGCGPTSIAMIMTTLGPKQSPLAVAMASDRRAGCGGVYQGTSGDDIERYLSPWIQKQGYTITRNLVSGGRLDTNLARNFLSKGYLIVGGGDVRYMTSSGYTSKYSGHAFVISNTMGSPNEDSFVVYDPTFCEAEGIGGLRKLIDVNNFSAGGKDTVRAWYFAYAIKKV